MVIKKHKGFNLIELMITVFIVGILGAIAVPYFSDNIIAANRSDGRSAVLRASAELEKCKALYNQYNHAKCTALFPILSPDGLYSVTAALAPSTYLLTATPLVTTTPADTDCTTITLSHTGVEGGSGANSSVCW